MELEFNSHSVPVQIGEPEREELRGGYIKDDITGQWMQAAPISVRLFCFIENCARITDETKKCKMPYSINSLLCLQISC
jgi:hypothetical protein